jgi:peptidyl-prolyl cis-trans isomerase B (cyclophilin B)
MSSNRDDRQRTPREPRNPRTGTRESRQETRQRERASPAWATEPNSPRALTTTFLVVGGAMALTLAIVLVAMSGVIDDLLAGPPPTEAPPQTPIAGLSPPAATPLATTLAAPSGDGTTATISTELGDIEIELFTESAPVATTNFINLSQAGFYEGVGFHRVIPGFMIQGGDPQGDGTGGPGFSIPDEPVVGDYERGIVAMARTQAPNSAGSQFFILVEDAPHLEGGGYVIFGEVLNGMDVVDVIVEGETGGPAGDMALDPVRMTGVTVERPD